jgi:NADH:ubiquinone oxidoreductase subunit 4 (subunit M)
MLLILLLIIPLLGILGIFASISYEKTSVYIKHIKMIALITSIINLLVSLVIFILFDYSINQFQFVQEHHETNLFDFYLGLDGLSIYFVLLTTIISPIALLSN